MQKRKNNINLNSLQDNKIPTKLTLPVTRPLLVQRSRLTNQIRLGMGKKLTLIVAPAGYGKTTLLCEWATAMQKLNWPIAWLSLDSSDNKPIRFWEYIIAALEKIMPDAEPRLSGMKKSTCAPGDCPLITQLIKEAFSYKKHFSLVLDDYHEIQNKDIHLNLDYLINNMPENMHVIINSRVNPEFRTARLRVHDQLVEINTSDLSFSSSEAHLFLQEVMDVKSSYEDAKKLVSLTEGWVSGLQMAALSLHGRQDIKHHIATFSGKHGYIPDYLMEEVLNKQEPRIKEFLLKTSILNELSAPLCDAILEVDDSFNTLVFLEKANLFISPMNEEKQWYRFHSLFADMLQTRLKQSYPKQVKHLHLAACKWLKNNCLPEKAIPHALAAGENDLAVEIIESCAFDAIIHFNETIYLSWIDQLPQEVIKSKPQLGVYNAIAQLSCSQVSNIEPKLADLEESLQKLSKNEISKTNYDRITREIQALKAAAVCIQGDYENGIQLAQQVLKNLKEEDFIYMGVLRLTMATAHHNFGNLTLAIKDLTCEAENIAKHGNHQRYVVTLYQLAELFEQQGQLKNAAKIYQQSINHAHNHGLDETYSVLPQTGLGNIHREWNEVKAMDSYMQTGLDHFFRIDTNEVPWYFTLAVEIYLYLAKNKLYYHDYKSAKAYIELANDRAQNYQHITSLKANIDAVQIQLWLEQGDLQSAMKWVDQVRPTLMNDYKFTRDIKQILISKVLLANKLPKQTNDLVSSFLSKAKFNEIGKLFIEALILKSAALWKMGNKSEAVDTMLTTLKLAEPENYILTFVDSDPIVYSILSTILTDHQRQTSSKNKDPLLVYIQKIISAYKPMLSKKEFVQTVPKTKQDVIFTDSSKLLSKRELEILVYVAEGYSAEGIAENLVISINTVKSHMKNIYGKLDVHNRSDAIQRAVHLNLFTYKE